MSTIASVPDSENSAPPTPLTEPDAEEEWCAAPNSACTNGVTLGFVVPLHRMPPPNVVTFKVASALTPVLLTDSDLRDQSTPATALRLGIIRPATAKLNPSGIFVLSPPPESR